MDQQCAASGKGSEVISKSLRAYRLIIVSPEERYDNSRQEETLRRVFANGLAMQDEMRRGVDMCAEMGTDAQLRYVPGRRGIRGQDAWFRVSRKYVMPFSSG